MRWRLQQCDKNAFEITIYKCKNAKLCHSSKRELSFQLDIALGDLSELFENFTEPELGPLNIDKQLSQYFRNNGIHYTHTYTLPYLLCVSTLLCCHHTGKRKNRISLLQPENILHMFPLCKKLTPNHLYGFTINYKLTAADISRFLIRQWMTAASIVVWGWRGFNHSFFECVYW